jgi:hypothetical protein
MLEFTLKYKFKLEKSFTLVEDLNVLSGGCQKSVALTHLLYWSICTDIQQDKRVIWGNQVPSNAQEVRVGYLLAMFG